MILCCSLLFTIPCFGQLQDTLHYIFYYENGTAREPDLGKDAYIINSDGDILHKWEGAVNGITSPEGSPGYLLPNGNFLRGVKAPAANNTDFTVGIWGKVQIVDWDNNVIWEYDGCTDGISCLHHDMEPLPNGNILVAAYVRYTTEEGASFGWKATGQTKLLIDKIYEIKPNMVDGSAEIVWEWFIADHTIQDVDQNLPNYGVVAENPGKLDINYYNSNEPFMQTLLGDHTHINSISYNQQRDEIIISSFTYNEIYVIDHSTTTEEAAGSTGGKSGKGGDILYRWGNPEVYDYGGGEPGTYSSWSWTDRQHDARWLMDGSGNITIHNNHSTKHPKPSGQQNAWSEFFEIEVPYDSLGNYLYTPGQPYRPNTPTILAEYDPQNPLFNDGFASGGQKLPNGHIFTGSAPKYTLLEHDENGEIVWFFDLKEIHPAGGQVYKPQKYPVEYTGFSLITTKDNTPPTIPTGLIATEITGNSIRAAWEASSDNVGVVAYNLFLGDQWIAATASTDYTLSALEPNTTYQISVSALDGVRNESARSIAIEVTTLDTVVGINLRREAAPLVNIYPNPSGDILTTEAYDIGQYKVKITAGNGQVLYEVETTEPVCHIDLSKIRGGIYYITIRSQDFTTTKKIIKQ